MSNSWNSKQIAESLTECVEGQVRADKLSIALYSTDASIYQIEPLCVVLPANEQDIANVVSFAAREGISVIPRGGGTGLAGEAIGRGVVIDMSHFMNRLIKIDAEANEVTVQPGMVLAELNQELAGIGKQIGPDPSSDAYATIGGTIGNNATGAHSLKYGYMGHHLRRARAIAANGEVVEIGRYSLNAKPTGQVGIWASEVRELLSANAEPLAKARPKPERNGSGYNVYPVLENGQVHLVELLAGSEGTLAVITEATLGIVDLPPVKVLLQVNFASLGNMARAVPHILTQQPAACELMDETLLKMARQAYPQYRDVLPDGVAASLLVEFDGCNSGEVQEKLRLAKLMVKQLPNKAQSIGTKEIVSSDLQARVWAARKAAVPLLNRQKGGAMPIPVIEDVAVAPEQLAQYLEKLQEITDRHNTPMAYYAHAGHGELHTRPYLDLHKSDQVDKLRAIAEDVFELAWSLGGTISGEHGEGLVRVSFIKKQYGDEVYDVFRKVKGIFDPKNVFNPGKIINDDPDIMVKNLRLANPAINADWQTNLNFKDDELRVEIEQCSGDGLCRSKSSLLTMCPIYRVLGDERASPRGKNNLMRHWLSGKLDRDILQSKEFKEVTDLCINCKMCSLECPSLVNTAKLMLEARVEYVKHHGLSKAQIALTNSEFMSRMGSTFAPVANVFLQALWFRRVMEFVLGLDRRRPMPLFDWGSNVKKLQRYVHKLPAIDTPLDKVAYFVDLYACFNDHQLGRAVVDILRHNNIEVAIPKQIGVSMPAITYGALGIARKAIKYNVAHLAKAIRNGYKVVCSEPTAALCLKEEYLDVVDSEDAKLVAENSYELTDYLCSLHRQGDLRTDFQRLQLKLAYHKPCHYKAMEIEGGTTLLLGLIAGVEIETLTNSCCGIAGTFGFQKKSFDLSMQIGEPMLESLRRSDADFGLTECGTCKMQMALATGKTVLHPVAVFARAYGLV